MIIIFFLKKKVCVRARAGAFCMYAWRVIAAEKPEKYTSASFPGKKEKRKFSPAPSLNWAPKKRGRKRKKERTNNPRSLKCSPRRVTASQNSAALSREQPLLPPPPSFSRALWETIQFLCYLITVMETEAKLGPDYLKEEENKQALPLRLLRRSQSRSGGGSCFFFPSCLLPSFLPAFPRERQAGGCSSRTAWRGLGK